MAVKFSAEYFKLSGKIRMVFEESGTDVGAEEFNTIKQEAFQAKSSGRISDEEYVSLMSAIDRGMSVERSDEFVRILQVYNDYTKAGTVPLGAVEREEIRDEISLAFTHGVLPENDRSDLLEILVSGSTVTANAPKSEDSAKIIGINSLSTRDVPSRQRRRTISGQVSKGSGYDELLAKYKDLYSAEALENKRDSVTAFFRDVDAAYRGGRISLKEFRDFHNALDSQEACMADIDISPRDRNFSAFKEQLLDLMGDDMMVEQVAKQVLLWLKKSGMSDKRIQSNPIGIASQALEDFFGANQSIVTMHTKTADGYQSLLKMKLS